MFLANGELQKKGKVEFAKRFKAQLKKNHAWEVEIVWEDTDNHEEKASFIAHIYANCLLTLSSEIIEEFGLEANGIESVECQKILDKKERKLVKKIQEVICP